MTDQINHWYRQTEKPDEYLNPRGDPAKGVAAHVLFVYGVDPTKLLSQSVEFLWDSHGNLDVIRAACPRVSLNILCEVKCLLCAITVNRATVTLPPGFRLRRWKFTSPCCEE